MFTFAEAGQGHAARARDLVCLLLALCSSACSRRASEHEPPSASGNPSATASARAAEPKGDTRLPPSKPAAPPAAPDVPPQLVACGERDFYRITRKALEVYEVAEKLPPPQIRGNRVARQTSEVAVDEPLNLFSSAKKRVLLIAKGGVYRYEFGQTQARRYAPIQASSPLVAWSDPRRADSFRVRSHADKTLQDYTLTRPTSGDAGSPPEAPTPAEHVVDMPGFDARLFTVLSDGTPLYSTPKGLVRHKHAAQPSPFPEPSGPATTLFADAAPDRFWAADASGHLALFDQKQGAPLSTASVPGVVIDTALEGERVAVLSMDLVSQSYRPTVTIFSNGKEQGRLSIGPIPGSPGQPKLDLCLMAGHPWVVVGGTRWVQLLDWATGRVLAEW